MPQAPQTERTIGYSHRPLEQIRVNYTQTEQATQTEQTTNTNGNQGDSYIPSNSEENTENIQNPTLNESPSFFKRMVGRLLNFGRRVWRNLRNFNPFTQILNGIENIRCRPHIENARSRNGAQTNEEISAYHRSLEFNPDNPSENALFRFYRAPGNQPRPLTVLFMGNSQTHASLPEHAGIRQIADRFREEGSDVLVLRVGEASNELMHRFGISSNCSLNTEVVYQNQVNIIQDIINGRGIFQRNANQNPTSPNHTGVFIGGYSFGGGAANRFANEHGNNLGIPVVGIATMDPIMLGSYHLGSPETQRPNLNCPYFTAYQDNSYAINGSSTNHRMPGDVTIYSPNDTHDTIDNNPIIQNRLVQFATNLFRGNNRPLN